MKPKSVNRKVSLQFMDVRVSIEGNYRNIDQKAYSLMAALVADRLRFQELVTEMSEGEDQDSSARKSKKKKLVIDREFMKMYV